MPETTLLLVRCFAARHPADKAVVSGVLHCQKYACGQPGQSGDEGAGQGVAGFCDFCGHEVNAHGIENGLGAGHGDGGDPSAQGICAGVLVNVQEQAGGCGGGEHFHNGQGHQLAGKSDAGGEMADDPGNKVEKSGGAKDSHGYHQADEGGHDLDDGEKTISRADDKIVVYADFLQDAVGNDGKDQEGDDKIRYVEEQLHEKPHFFERCSLIFMRKEGMFRTFSVIVMILKIQFVSTE